MSGLPQPADGLHSRWTVRGVSELPLCPVANELRGLLTMMFRISLALEGSPPLAFVPVLGRRTGESQPWATPRPASAPEIVIVDLAGRPDRRQRRSRA